MATVTEARVNGGLYTVTADGRLMRVASPAAGAGVDILTNYLGHGWLLLLVRDGVRQPAWVAEDGARRWVYCDGEVTVVELAAPAGTRRRPAAAGGLGRLTAPMPASVIRIVAAPGSRVAHGDTVLLLEAMKMELPLRAPHDAIVRAVHCQAGDLVQPDVPLVDLDPLA